MTTPPDRSAVDIPVADWIERWVPCALRPYLRLARIDRPIGVWLLLLPCWWGVALASPSWPDGRLLILFAIGAVVMRAAGCTLNDIADRDFDRRVARTATRPIASGAVSVRGAVVFMVALCLSGLGVLLQFNRFTVGLGVVSLALVAVYPLMKRVTYWPQAVLGMAFNWGALLGWAAVTGDLGVPALALYVAGVFWTLGYDTIYAHQDKHDDAVIGVKSTALLFGDTTRWWLFGFSGVSLAAFAVAGAAAGLASPFFVVLAGAGAHLVWLAARVDLDDAKDCLATFRANRTFGLLILAAIVVGRIAG